jgi:probable rRNA maturation factor
MGLTVRLHDHVGAERLEGALEPLSLDAGEALLRSAMAETTRQALGAEAEDAEVELTLCGDAEMERLNFDHMGERGVTDVLSIPLHEWSIDGLHSHRLDEDGVGPPGAAVILGDVVIDVDQAVRQSTEGSWTPLEELVLLAIHGALHLVGHDHADLDEEAAMRSMERQVLNVLHRKHREVPWQPGSLFDRAGHAVTSGA